MRNKGIVFKLFIITAGSFIVLLTISMAVQASFFDEFFISRRIEKIEVDIDKFSMEYQKSKWNEKTIHKNIKLFSDENDAQIAILNRNGLVKYMNHVNITILNSKGKDIIIPLSNFLYLYDFEDLNITIGEDIKATGVYFLENTLLPLRIEVGERVLDIYEVIEGDDSSISDIDTETVRGKIKKINIPSSIDSMIIYDEDIFLAAIDDLFSGVEAGEIILSSDITTYIFKDFLSNKENIVFVKPIIKDDKINELIFVISSLESMNEMKDIMKEYYFYIFLAALVVIIVLAFIYSKMVSRPLVEINKVAKKMADLDFSSYCEVKADDEIGSLSRSLNTLSKNLNNSLEELKKANNKLVEDIEKEKELEEMRKEFVSSASHELKTPLGIIKGFAEGIKDGIYEEKKGYYLDVILDETEKMEDLVLDMLDLSKLESKSYKLNREELIIDKLVFKVINKFKNHIERKKLSINCDFYREDILVYGDKRRTEQVIVNLLSNAIRHTEVEGYITISINSEEARVNISIENSGKQISKEKIDRIWDRFYRVEESRDKQSGGTGLGLAIVKNILELHDSKYGVKNTEKGVLFYFTLEKPIA